MVKKAARIRSFAALIARETNESVAIIEYGLKNAIYTVACLLGVVGVGYLLGVLPAVIMAYLAGGTLRIVSGGGHTVTPIRCMVLTSLFFGVIGLAATHAAPYLVGPPLMLFSATVLVLVLYVIARFAPRDTPNKPIGKERKLILKKWSLGLWVLWAVLITVALVIRLPAKLILAAVLGIGFQGFSVVESEVRTSA